MKRFLVLALLLMATPALAQTQPNWQAIAAALRNQRDQANDTVVQQEVAAAAQIGEANGKIMWWAKCVADPVCVTWANSGNADHY